MTEFEKLVAQAAIAANPAPQSHLTQNVVEMIDVVGKVKLTLTKLVGDEILVCENTMPPAGLDSGTWGSQQWGSIPPTFFRYSKGPNWKD